MMMLIGSLFIFVGISLGYISSDPIHVLPAIILALFGFIYILICITLIPLKAPG